MKKTFVIFLTLTLFSFFSFFSVKEVKAENLANCLHATVKISATNWPGGTITAQCDGDTGPSGCTGESGSAAPGGIINLQKCSCPPYASGCINIPNSQIPAGCKSEPISAPVCGTNGNTLNISLIINCPEPCPNGAGFCGASDGKYATACPNGEADPASWYKNGDAWCQSPSYNKNNNQAPYCYTRCKPTPTPTPSPTPTKSPSITNPPVSYPPYNPPPTNPPATSTPPTPTPTSPLTCGADCSQNPNVCQNIAGCEYCNPTNKKCEAQPTATPTPTPLPTATPTPTPLPFDESMCKCDSINFTPIVIGEKTKITAYGKVLGVNKNYAKIPTFTFTWYQSPPNGTTATIKKQEKVNATIFEETTEQVRYQSVWDLQIPADLDTTQTYRIQAHPDCSKKASFYTTTASVAGSNTSKEPSLWERITGFFAKMFNLTGSTPQTVNPAPTPTPTLTKQRDSLQLKTFRPATVSTEVDVKSCTFIKFSF